MVAADYKSYGKFSPVYDHAIDRLYDCGIPVDRARQAEKVLRSYVEHANAIGTCYPGIDRIRARTRYTETTIKRAWLVLGELDYIRVHREYSAARRKTTDTFQISPYVMWITVDHIDEAETLWKSTSLRCNEIIQGQPESLTRIRTSFTNQNQEPSTEPPTPQNPAPQKADDKKRSPANQRKAQNQNQQGKNRPDQNQRNAQKQNPSPHSAPPPPPLEACQESLEDKHEALAVRIATSLNTRLPQARQLVMQFGCETVDAGLLWLELEDQKGVIQRPFGLLKWWLEQGAVHSDDVPRPASLNGKYADFFER